MLITLVQAQPGTGARLTIGVSEDRADGVISAMATDGWRVLSKYYGRVSPLAPVVDAIGFNRARRPRDLRTAQSPSAAFRRRIDGR